MQVVIQNGWTPLCVQLRSLGHTVDKVELIVMGGTFMSLPADYRDFFIRSLHDALSGGHSSSVAQAVKSASAPSCALLAAFMDYGL